MSNHRHDWYMSEAGDGGLYHCRKCRHTHEGTVPRTHNCPASNAEHNAAAWLGPAGLYRTRLEAVQNGEQHVEPVSADKLIELALSHIREGHSCAKPQKERHS